MNVVLSKDVSQFLDELNHPKIDEINNLRIIILKSNAELEENFKWNSPNYSFRGKDRITMRIQPPKQIQLIFHRGAKKIEQPTERIIQDSSSLLQWKENDRALLTFRNAQEIENSANELKNIICKWLLATQ